jgi:flagellar biosynthesis/type III secretory pathway M-ring protein FliF/YscJ
VVVSLMPVVLGTVGGGGGGARTGIGSGIAGGSGGGGGIVAKLLNGGVIKQLVLSVLALVALGMMFVLVKKTSKPPEMPTAEELVGIPPAISPDSDLVGEADESDTAMLGIEVDSDSLKTGKMLEEVQDHVRKNPQAAATVFTRWLAAEE